MAFGDANLPIQAPDFDRIRTETGSATFAALRSIWNILQSEIQTRQRRRFHWQDEPYSKVTFGASAGTWTVDSGDFLVYRWAQFVDTLWLTFSFGTTSTSAGMGGVLTFTLPGHRTAFVGSNFSYTGVATFSSSGVTAEMSNCGIDPANPTKVSLLRGTGVAWPSAETNTLSVRGSVFLQVQ